MRYPYDDLTDETLMELEQIQEQYRMNPLERKNIIKWNGPLLYPECVVDMAKSSNALRQPLEALLSSPSPCRPGPGGPGWQLELLSPIAVGDYEDRNSQIWSCKVRRGSEVVGEVVAKFYFRGWFRYPFRVNRKVVSWFVDHDGIAKTEARAYPRLQAIQGSQVPFCYGTFNFELPGNLEVKGIVLEDLIDTMQSVCNNFIRTQIRETGVGSYSKWIDVVLRGILLNLHTIHNCKIMVRQSMFAKDIFIPRNFLTSHTDLHNVTFVGFTYSQAFEDLLTPEATDRSLRGMDSGNVIESLEELFDSRIGHRWQYWMRENGQEISPDFEVVYDAGRLYLGCEPHEGEFINDSDYGLERETPSPRTEGGMIGGGTVVCSNEVI